MADRPHAGSGKPSVVVIGGGILGLATAARLHERGHPVTVLEKEPRWAAHQTGNNSNVVHAGLYYAPGSAKARMSVAGNAAMIAFARQHGVPVEVCGKLVVAVAEEELPALHELARRAQANGVPARLVAPAEAREYEPNVRCVGALRVESTAVVDYAQVCAALVRGLPWAELRPGTAARAIREHSGRIEVATDSGVIRADRLVNCAGLHADRVAWLAGVRPSARIVPFRGEYWHLRGDARELVRGLIYPVPDASLPFLGVHLTRMLDGSVHAGPNAVLALHREGYRWRDVAPAELAALAGYPGLWRLGRRYWRTGVDEVARSVSRKRFAASAARLVPGITAEDLVPGGAGVRAQAMRADGSLVQDFLIETAPRQVHVLNAPSPAATCAFQIGEHIVEQLQR